MPIQSFSNVDELEEANRKAGWNLEYHQLGRGPFSAHFAARQWGEALLMRERFGASMEIVGEPPDGAVAVIVPVSPVLMICRSIGCTRHPPRGFTVQSLVGIRMR